MRAASSSLLLLALLAARALAEPTAADQTFKRGRELMRDHKYAEACAAFEQSQRLDPEFGTLFNLATCEEKLGKLASAYNHFRELAKVDTNAARRAQSADEASKLAPKVPKLVVSIAPSPPPPSLELTIDGADSSALVGVEVPVDLGTHAIVARAPGYPEHRETVEIARPGETTKLVVHLDKPREPEPAAKPEPKPAPPPAPAAKPNLAVHADPDEDERPAAPTSSRARYGKLAMIGGGAVVAGGLVVGGLAWAKWSDAQSCSSCNKADTSHSAVVLGDVSTVLVIAGAVPLVAGVYLWRTSSSSATVAPAAAGEGVSIIGSF